MNLLAQAQPIVTPEIEWSVLWPLIAMVAGAIVLLTITSLMKTWRDGFPAMYTVIIGAIAGIIVVLSVFFFDKIKVDDPVGAISVHGVNGVWGTLAAGLFNIGGTSAKIIGVQLLGIGACFVWTFCTAFILFKIIDKTVGLRVSPDEEREGLDYTEHGGNAYPDFEVSSYVQK